MHVNDLDLDYIDYIDVMTSMSTPLVNKNKQDNQQEENKKESQQKKTKQKCNKLNDKKCKFYILSEFI